MLNRSFQQIQTTLISSRASDWSVRAMVAMGSFLRKVKKKTNKPLHPRRASEKEYPSNEYPTNGFLLLSYEDGKSPRACSPIVLGICRGRRRSCPPFRRYAFRKSPTPEGRQTDKIGEPVSSFCQQNTVIKQLSRATMPDTWVRCESMSGIWKIFRPLVKTETGRVGKPTFNYRLPT